MQFQSFKKYWNCWKGLKLFWNRDRVAWYVITLLLMAEPDWKLVEIVTKWIEMGGKAGYGWKCWYWLKMVWLHKLYAEFYSWCIDLRHAREVEWLRYPVAKLAGSAEQAPTRSLLMQWAAARVVILAVKLLPWSSVLKNGSKLVFSTLPGSTSLKDIMISIDWV